MIPILPHPRPILLPSDRAGAFHRPFQVSFSSLGSHLKEGIATQFCPCSNTILSLCAYKWSEVNIAQLCLTLCDSIDYTVHGILQARDTHSRILKWAAFPFSRGFSQPKDQMQVSCIAGRFFTSWATRETWEYWVGSLSLLQQIFLTQELNWDLLSCRRILYQLIYQGSHVCV